MTWHMSLNSRMHWQMVSMLLLSNNGTENLHFSVIPCTIVTVQDKVSWESLVFVNFETRG